MEHQLKVVLFLTLSVFIPLSLTSQVSQNQTDNFQNGTLSGWVSGGANPNPPVNINSNGPGGSGDKYMRLTSTGAGGAGGKLVVQNSAQWVGNYSSVGITNISMHVKNEGSTALQLRLVVKWPGGNVVSVNPVSLPVGGGWTTAVFPISVSSLTGGDVSSALANVIEIRLLHSTTASPTGESIAAQLGVDDITAAASPMPVELIAFTGTTNRSNVELRWKTATEVDNFGFEVERIPLSFADSPFTKGDKRGFQKVGLVEGSGTSNIPKAYSYTDRNVSAGNYEYRLKQIDRNGKFEYSKSVQVEIAVPHMLTLSENYPNPFNPTTTIEFTLPEDGKASLKIYDVLGREVATLVNGELKAGVLHQATFDASELSSGIYFSRLEFSASGGKDKQLMKKLLLIK